MQLRNKKKIPNEMKTKGIERETFFIHSILLKSDENSMDTVVFHKSLNLCFMYELNDLKHEGYFVRFVVFNE